MFEVSLSEEEILIQDAARKFAAGEIASSVREFEEKRAVSDDLLAQYIEMGFDLLDSVDDMADSLSPLARLVVFEELAAVDGGSAYALDRYGYARYLLSAAGLDELVAALDADLSGRGLLLLDEDEHFSYANGKLSGSHPWVPADRLTLLVVVQKERAFVVKQGFDLTELRPCGLDAAGGSALTLSDAAVEHVVDDAKAIAQGVARARLSVASLLIGSSRGAFEYACDYAQEREAFGKPIAHHQGLAFLISEMSMSISAARAYLWRAIADISGSEFPSLAANAFAEAAEQALFVAPNAVQVLGGHGYVRDFLTEKWMRDIRTLAQLLGGRDLAELSALDNITEKNVGLR
jgi:acyl-CoA dehydrogenase